MKLGHIALQSFPACGPLQQLAGAQAGQGNSLKKSKKPLHDGMGNSAAELIFPNTLEINK